jgi:hypothetical protein
MERVIARTAAAADATMDSVVLNTTVLMLLLLMKALLPLRDLSFLLTRLPRLTWLPKLVVRFLLLVVVVSPSTLILYPSLRLCSASRSRDVVKLPLPSTKPDRVLDSRAAADEEEAEEEKRSQRAAPPHAPPSPMHT